MVFFDGENISFDACLLTCINKSIIPPIMILGFITAFLPSIVPRHTAYVK